MSGVNKSAMAASQLLIMVMSLVVMGLVVILGFKAISGLNQKTAEAELLQFQSQLQQDITGLAPQFESVKIYGAKHQLRVPRDVSDVCFVDNPQVGLRPFDTNPSLFDALDSPTDGFPVVYESVKTNVRKNVFLLGHEQIVHSFYLDPIHVLNGITSVVPWWCKKVINGQLPLRLEGRGDSVLVTP